MLDFGMSVIRFGSMAREIMRRNSGMELVMIGHTVYMLDFSRIFREK